MSETRDEVSVRIDNILLELPSSRCKPSIFRVNDDIRHTNGKLYDPKVISIGPFHHGKDQLRDMEQHKFRYLKLLLKRRNESSVDKYVMAMRSLEGKARKCYAGPVEFSPDDFVQMLLLDGCFIIELIRKYGIDELRESDDIVFQKSRRSYSFLIQLFIDDISPWPEASEMTGKISLKTVDHLLGLVYRIWCSSFAKITANRPIKVVEEEHKMVAINSTTELQEAGIKFQRDTQSNCLDIKFIKGVMKIPGLSVSDETESIFRNIMAYEHFFIDNQSKYVTDYAFFLHCLINSSKDVEVLRRHGILTNLLGDDEMVYHMFNRLGTNILMSSDFCYADVYKMVNGHYGRRWNKWIANLRRNYFNSPWAYTSFFAALFLLLFTLIQTVFTVLSYVKPKAK
ncbi:hypothetical protein Sango_2165400 [Sesamum angolense]|uniref:Uncharacterized protein n=1 Tax=Sesamum angolense TaxID=2727404 RepID=A0AAE1WD50_9LAMI|nr:hypothetical protein Sango_2165400 [Sesamum angolense]